MICHCCTNEGSIYDSKYSRYVCLPCLKVERDMLRAKLERANQLFAELSKELTKLAETANELPKS